MQRLAALTGAGLVTIWSVLAPVAAATPHAPEVERPRLIDAPRSSVDAAIPGERYVLAGRLPPSAADRVVQLQRLGNHGRWVLRWWKRADSRGRYQFDVWADRREGTWRAVVPAVETKGVRRRAIRTRVVRVPITAQQISVAAVPATATWGSSLSVTASVLPARPGHRVELRTVARDGSWSQLGYAVQDRNGTATFAVPLMHYGQLDLSITVDATTRRIGSVRVTPGRTPRLVAHRGGRFAPENTMPNFRAAIAAGTPAVEADIQRTSDGHWVLMHDPDVLRTTDAAAVFPDRSSYAVSSFTLAQILQLTAGAPGVKVPTLDEFFELVSESGVEAVIDPKVTLTSTYARQLASLAASYPRLVTSGSDDLLMWNINTPTTAVSVPSEIPDGRLVYQVTTGPWPDDSALSRYEIISVERSTVTVAELARAHALGVKVYVWTVNDAQSVGAFASAGLDGIFTDDVTMASELLTGSPFGRWATR
ncbi:MULTISPECIES: glycerophosphodiester phosphodiesterase [Nocardioides]|nr:MULTISPECIES: glycerophosphodiester phosphodiesterase family protein [unclassified Nocardioides]